ncbi:acyl transferase/acyl hydrolase/lysophospholipase [Fennellomyces sp. T-0311]|nr:acyl transferase/acyl hydrolase/lysophospholipase [Fennellomyces sp. T-0311]
MDEFRQLVKDTEAEAKDVECHPEVAKDAFVRRGATLCQHEQAFVQARKQRQRQAFAKFIGVPVHQVDLQDIPVVGIASSGGGFRAMIGSAGYMKAMQESGALDLVMYAAGVSGSCWTLAQYYSPLTNASLDQLVDHMKSHTHTHLANLNNFIAILKASPRNSKLLMQGIIERYCQQDGEINLVDVFGMLLGGTLLTKREAAGKGDQGAIVEANGQHVKPVILDRMKLSRQTTYFEDGSLPMPIYCVVRIDEDAREKDVYQWYEFTPFEMGSEEINAWIPVWAFGRRFDQGKNTQRIPEQTLGIMMGVFGSAFAASLAHFYKEIRGFMPSTALEKADEIIIQFKDSMAGFYPISPACFPNPFYQLPGGGALAESKQLCLADAGLDNNIPFYPLLREGREADVIIAIDLSADIQTSAHFDRAEGYANRRGISGWPVGAGWPKQGTLGTCTVFASQTYDQQPIAVVYFPLITNPSYDPAYDPQTNQVLSTWNFVYSADQVAKLTGLAEKNWNDNVEQVKHVLRQVWQRKRTMRLNQRIAQQEDVFRIA